MTHRAKTQIHRLDSSEHGWNNEVKSLATDIHYDVRSYSEQILMWLYYILLQHKHAEVSELNAIHSCFDPVVNICAAKSHKPKVTTLNSNREESSKEKTGWWRLWQKSNCPEVGEERVRGTEEGNEPHRDDFLVELHWASFQSGQTTTRITLFHSNSHCFFFCRFSFCKDRFYELISKLSKWLAFFFKHSLMRSFMILRKKGCISLQRGIKNKGNTHKRL